RPYWDAYLRPAATAADLQSAIATVRFHLERAEVRQRVRRLRDAEVHSAQITATVCSLAKALHRGDLSLRVPLRNDLLNRESRYKSPLQTASLRTVIHKLIEEGFM